MDLKRRSIPGEIEPPRYSPFLLVKSNFKQVPMSIVRTFPLLLRLYPATELQILSKPKVLGVEYSIEIGSVEVLVKN